MEERRRLNDRLHRRYGHAQFAAGEYEEAMAHFGMCSDASPVVLLRLFPSLAAPEALEPLLPSRAGVPLDPDIPASPLAALYLHTARACSQIVM